MLMPSLVALAATTWPTGWSLRWWWSSGIGSENCAPIGSTMSPSSVYRRRGCNAFDLAPLGVDGLDRQYRPCAVDTGGDRAIVYLVNEIAWLDLNRFALIAVAPHLHACRNRLILLAAFVDHGWNARLEPILAIVVVRGSGIGCPPVRSGCQW